MSSSPATREELGFRLHELGVHDCAYSPYGAHVDDAIVMDRRPQGWVVFYSERGGESSPVVCETEAEACSALLRRVTADEHVFFDLVAGPAPHEEADDLFDQWLVDRDVTRADLDDAEWKMDEMPWAEGPRWRRYFVRVTTARRLESSH